MTVQDQNKEHVVVVPRPEHDYKTLPSPEHSVRLNHTRRKTENRIYFWENLSLEINFSVPFSQTPPATGASTLWMLEDSGFFAKFFRRK